MPLSSKDSDNYYRIIKRNLFRNVNTVEHPTAVFFAGQSGAGKTNLKWITLIEFTGNGAVIVDPDQILMYHPQYQNYFENKLNIYELKADCWPWIEQLTTDALSKNCNIIFDGTFGNDTFNRLLNKINICRLQGYNLKIHCLAVNETVSKIGITSRYERTVKELGNGRKVPFEVHNGIYRRIPENINAALLTAEIAEVAIFGRSYNPDKTILINRLFLKRKSTKSIAKFANETYSGYRSERIRLFKDMEVDYLNDWFIKTGNLVDENNGDFQEYINAFEILDEMTNDELTEQIIQITTFPGTEVDLGLAAR